MLYRGENQELAAYRTALPFSQLLDGVELPEGAETEARIQWASSEIRVLRTENGPAFGITVTVCAVLLVRRKQQVSYIEDLYSLHHAAQVRRQETPLPVLKLCCDKALACLNWRATLDFDTTMRFTAKWYEVFYREQGADIYAFTQSQIQDYCRKAAALGLPWSSDGIRY